MGLTVETHMDKQNAINELATAIKQYVKTDKPIKIICIGTDRSTGDSLGPLVGQFLKAKGFKNIIGFLDEPVHAQNLVDVLETNNNFKDFFVIGVDACLGASERIGKIVFRSTPLKPGNGVNKCLPKVGDVHIEGIVNVGGYYGYMILQNTRLNIVWKQAEIIAGAIEAAFTKEGE